MSHRQRIHWNLHKHCFSVVDTKTGRVVEHTNGPVYMEDVQFVVQPAGRARVLREQRKNVHAFVRGQRAEAPADGRVRGVNVRYNPYEDGYWKTAYDGAQVGGASFVVLHTVDGKPVVTILT